jgi:flagellar motor switch protein FliG
MKMKTLNGLDKAAVFFTVLGEDLALTLFGDLDEEMLIKIRVRMREIGRIPTLLKKDILEEYYFKILTENKRSHPNESIQLFGFVDELSNEQIYYLLAKESPKVIALTIEQLNEERKTNLLNKFEKSDPDLKSLIVFEIGDLDDIPLKAVVEIAKELKKKISFLPEPKEFSRGGGKSMANILNGMSEEEALLYLDQLSQDNPMLYADVKKYYISFEDLLLMPDHLMQDFWMNPEIDLDKLSFALKTEDEETVNHIVDFLPKKKQAMFEIKEQPVPKREIDEARASIVIVARKLEKEGKLNFEDLDGGEMVE